MAPHPGLTAVLYVKGIRMGPSTASSHLTPVEEAFLRALLWEESHLQPGPATRAASEHGLSLLRCLEAANRLSPNLHGEALARIHEGEEGGDSD